MGAAVGRGVGDFRAWTGGCAGRLSCVRVRVCGSACRAWRLEHGEAREGRACAWGRGWGWGWEVKGAGELIQQGSAAVRLLGAAEVRAWPCAHGSQLRHDLFLGWNVRLESATCSGIVRVREFFESFTNL